MSDFTLPKKRKDGENLEDRLTDNAYQRILPARYLQKDENGEINETPEELFERVAKNVAQPDKNYNDISYEQSWKQFHSLMTNLKFMPNSPTLMNAGGELQQLSACFVTHPEDDMESIFETSTEAALIHKSGGGTGYPFHLLRPKGDLVESTGGVSSGPMSFMEVFDATCGTVKQGGKRRGAQMGIMRADHPDILRFAVAKRIEGNLSNFNISVGVTDDFMEAVKNNEEYELINPKTGEVFETSQKTVEFYSSDPDNYPEAMGSDQGKDDNFWRDFSDNFSDDIEQFRDYCKDIEEGEPFTLPARFVFEVMVDGAWRNGEPGFYHYDETNRKHSFDVEKHPEYKIEATNPCGEQPLMNYEACNLGHVNLSLLVESDAAMFDKWRADNITSEEGEVKDLDEQVRDYLDTALMNDELERICRIGTRFLDNVVTQSDFPLEEIEETVTQNRKIGVGLMGFAQMLIQMGVEYGSDESIAIAKEIQRRITANTVQESHRLAQVRGTFGNYNDSKWSNPEQYSDWFMQFTGYSENPEDHINGYKMRNHNTTTIAPTGTTSMIGDTSGGCEPVYSLAYFKNVAKDIQGEDMLVEFDDYFIQALQANDVDVEKVKADAQEKMENNEWNGVQSISDNILPADVKQVFKTTSQITGDEHLEIQAAFQKFNHSGISKTCNFPNDATRQEVKDAYLKAHELGIKGFTVYRDGTRDTQVMQTNKENKVVETVDVKQWVDEADAEQLREVKDKITSKNLDGGE